MSVKLPTQPPIPRDVAASFAAAAAKDDKKAKQASGGKSTDAGKADASAKAPFVASAGIDAAAVPAFPPAMAGFMQGAKFPLPQVGANPFAPPAGYPPMPVPPPHSGPAGSQPGAAAGTAQWNAMLQYYAYYSYLLCNGGMGGPVVDGAVPRVAPPPLVDVSAWRPGARAGGTAVPGLPHHAGMPGAPPGMTAAHMQSVAAMVAAMGAGQHAMAAAAAAMAAPHGKRADGKKRERRGDDSGDDASDSGGSSSSKRGKKRGANGDAQKTCVNCGVSRTPFWRKERVGGGSLCNACGLYLAKNDAPRPAMLWRRGGSGAGAAEGGGGGGGGGWFRRGRGRWNRRGSGPEPRGG